MQLPAGDLVLLDGVRLSKVGLMSIRKVRTRPEGSSNGLRGMGWIQAGRPETRIVIATCSRDIGHLVVDGPEREMTPRERKDMPWLVTAFAIVLMVIVVGAFVVWR